MRERASGTSPKVCESSIEAIAPTLLPPGSIRTQAWAPWNAAIPPAQPWFGPSLTEPATTPSTRSAVALGFATFQAFSMFVSCV